MSSISDFLLRQRQAECFFSSNQITEVGNFFISYLHSPSGISSFHSVFHFRFSIVSMLLYVRDPRPDIQRGAAVCNGGIALSVHLLSSLNVGRPAL